MGRLQIVYADSGWMVDLARTEHTACMSSSAHHCSALLEANMPCTEEQKAGARRAWHTERQCRWGLQGGLSPGTRVLPQLPRSHMQK